MGIIKISDELHEELRQASKAMSRSMNAQAEHWIKIGLLAELNPGLCYSDLIAMMLKTPDLSIQELLNRTRVA